MRTERSRSLATVDQTTDVCKHNGYVFGSKFTREQKNTRLCCVHASQGNQDNDSKREKNAMGAKMAMPDANAFDFLYIFMEQLALEGGGQCLIAYNTVK